MGVNMIPTDFRGRAARATLEDFANASAMLGVELAAMLAVWAVECAGQPFLQDGRPAMLFEAHIFGRLTGRVHDATAPDLSSPTWNRALYSPTRSGEYARLARAMALSRDAALMAASWGGCQILGANYQLAGFATVQAMVAALCDAEGAHIGAFGSFIRARGLEPALRAKDWATFAAGYNGSAYRANRYDQKLAAAYAANIGALADGMLSPGDKGDAVAVLQRTLIRAGHDISDDGAFGRMTALAVETVQARAGLPVTGIADAATLAALQSLAGVAA